MDLSVTFHERDGNKKIFCQETSSTTELNRTELDDAASGGAADGGGGSSGLPGPAAGGEAGGGACGGDRDSMDVDSEPAAAASGSAGGGGEAGQALHALEPEASASGIAKTKVRRRGKLSKGDRVKAKRAAERTD